MPLRDTPFQDESSPNLAQAILLMTQELHCRKTLAKQAKVKKPDVFDGSDPQKLNNFILLCDLFFHILQ